MAVAPSCIKSTCGKGEWFHYKSVACIQEEDCHIENGHSYREGDDDDDGDYDYAPAA